MKICRDCGIEFSKKSVKAGYANQCDDCSEEKVERHLGFNDGTINKSVHTSIYRGTDKTVRSKLKNPRARVHS